ncbi:hypothetical protein D3P08_14590 [Paenibacillus nanensis]|uniref:Uncharacterized protein n=1 Tax=Paenibacillus nanensis TaxID=393251 RepID=A0A3A1V0Q1_9BACL|nr:hypothetical protein D3P08_14590 [Paenibacillus nanensis]
MNIMIIIISIVLPIIAFLYVLIESNKPAISVDQPKLKLNVGHIVVLLGAFTFGVTNLIYTLNKNNNSKKK